MNRQAFSRRAFDRQAFRRAFGSTTAPTESPLQQAVIAAWDMQEESGPLLPAKGGIEIPAFNSPGFVSTPFGALTARSVEDAQRKFEGPTPILFDAPGKTLRIFVYAAPSGFGFERTIGIGPTTSNGQTASTNGHAAVRISGNNGAAQFLIRDTSNTQRASAVTLPSYEAGWYRLEFGLLLNGKIFVHATRVDTGETAFSENDFTTAQIPPNTDFSLNTRDEVPHYMMASFLGRPFTPEERTADLTPRLLADL